MPFFLKKHIPNNVKKFIRFFIDIYRLFYGLAIFTFFNKRLNESHLSFIRLFCLTRGLSNDLLTKLIKITNKPYSIKKTNGILGDLDKKEIRDITNELNSKGYYISKKLLPQELCEKLIAFSLQQPAFQHPIDGQDDSFGKYTLYNRNSPEATMYSFPLQDLVNFSVIQDLISDPSLLAITQAYMQSKVYFDICMLWWSTAFQTKPDDSAAQLFHFDMDRIKWLKIFVYLTDVNSENGPHTFVSGSHRTNGIPKELLKKGYSRHTDEEVLKYFDPKNIIQFTGPVGTIIIEDTRGLHKGTHLSKGDRLMLELQYSNHMFGATCPEGKFLCLTDKLKKSIEQYPKLYSMFTT